MLPWAFGAATACITDFSELPADGLTGNYSAHVLYLDDWQPADLAAFSSLACI
jgi:hypothetical protein